MSKPPLARYRTTDWSSHNASLRKRGSLLIRVDKDMIWRAPHDGRPGRPPVFSDAAMQFRLSIEVPFKLPLRQAAGMVASLLKLARLDRPVPDFSTLCRRQSEMGPWPRWGRASPSNTGRADPMSPCRWAIEPAGRQHRDQVPRRRRVGLRPFGAETIRRIVSATHLTRKHGQGRR